MIWAINTLFLLHAGLTIFEVFVANAAFTAAMALFEIPTGVVADTRGRRLSFLLCAGTLAVGTLAQLVFGDDSDLSAVDRIGQATMTWP